MNCDVAREYCGAVADGEVGMVPALVLRHIEACPDCSAEVEWQREAQLAVASALISPDAGERQLTTPPRPVRWSTPPRWAVAVAAVVILALGAGIFSVLPRRTSVDAAMLDAVHNYGNGAGIATQDSAAVDGWSVGVGLPVHVMAIEGETLAGARVSHLMNHDVVTILYSGSRGMVEVSMVPGRLTAGWPTMEATNMEHLPVGLMRHGEDSMIIVAGNEPALHSTMTLLQNGAAG